MKILLDALAQNKEFIKRFDREAKIAAKLSHNNIVNAIDAGEVDGHHYFVMEYVEGVTIKDELDKNKVFDEKVALKIVLAVAEALKHALSRGLIHRDIKPENVILTKDGNVKLADLGLARLTADEKWAMSEAGMAIGTPYYISPEQVRGQVDVDIRADIYSLGATLYHMVTGRVPYDGETPTEVMRKHVDKNVAFIPPDHINTALSSGLGMVVETMMAKNRENRYRNPDDLILDLKCLLQGDSPMIAGQKPDTLAVLADGESEETGAGRGDRRRAARGGRLRQQPQQHHRDPGASCWPSRPSPTSSSSSPAEAAGLRLPRPNGRGAGTSTSPRAELDAGGAAIAHASGCRSLHRSGADHRSPDRDEDRASSREGGVQFLLKSNRRSDSLPSGSLRNLPWQAGQRSKRKPLRSWASRSSGASPSSRWRSSETASMWSVSRSSSVISLGSKPA